MVDDRIANLFVFGAKYLVFIAKYFYIGSRPEFGKDFDKNIFLGK